VNWLIPLQTQNWIVWLLMAHTKWRRLFL
jgi:hypothetical protein